MEFVPRRVARRHHALRHFNGEHTGVDRAEDLLNLTHLRFVLQENWAVEVRDLLLFSGRGKMRVRFNQWKENAPQVQQYTYLDVRELAHRLALAGVHELANLCCFGRVGGWRGWGEFDAVTGGRNGFRKFVFCIKPPPWRCVRVSANSRPRRGVSRPMRGGHAEEPKKEKHAPTTESGGPSSKPPLPPRPPPRPPPKPRPGDRPAGAPNPRPPPPLPAGGLIFAGRVRC